jgi:hypothetical protein
MRTPKWAVGMQKIGPGVYVDKDRALHLDEAGFAEHLGVPYTRETQRVIQEEATRVFREKFPAMETEFIEDPKP